MNSGLEGKASESREVILSSRATFSRAIEQISDIRRRFDEASPGCKAVIWAVVPFSTYFIGAHYAVKGVERLVDYSREANLLNTCF